MLKSTKRGLESLGKPRELSKEDLEFIKEMFEGFSDHQKTDESEWAKSEEG